MLIFKQLIDPNKFSLYLTNQCLMIGQFWRDPISIAKKSQYRYSIYELKCWLAYTPIGYFKAFTKGILHQRKINFCSQGSGPGSKLPDPTIKSGAQICNTVPNKQCKKNLPATNTGNGAVSVREVHTGMHCTMLNLLAASTSITSWANHIATLCGSWWGKMKICVEMSILKQC
jgi:hypothetical protein